MSTSEKSAPFRADQVGSLLRPAAVADAHAKWRRGEIPPQALRAVEDRAIDDLISRQESIGLAGVTDGEIRREYWHIDFLSQLEGVTIREQAGAKFAGREEQPPIATVSGQLAYRRPIMIEDFRYLARKTRATAKMTIPSPSMLHLRAGRAGISSAQYPDLEAFWADAARAYRDAIRAFAEAGCRYLQLDDVAFAYLGDESFRAQCRRNGDDPALLPAQYAKAVNAALHDRPRGMTITMHTCHGNFRSSSATHGGYTDIVEALFSCDVDGFFMEFDSEHEEGFSALRRLPSGKRVVLGLVTTKVGQIEPKELLKRRIDMAARCAPLESLCLSPQCGFASTYHGNDLSEADQWRKLELVVEVAREVWGSAS
jgi:5-methyltetrahydropteroyltriglutamate--homocysteine methyltransferase